MKSSKCESNGGWSAGSATWGPALFAALSLAAVMSGCGEDSVAPSDTTNEVLLDVEDGDGDADVLETSDTTDDVEILYPGNLCDEDEQCATGLCYGVATSQGFFEPAKCQTKCLDLFNYSRYCDSNADCCKGRCCIGCGSQEGLCVLQ